MLRFLTFLIGVMMVSTSSAGEVSQCPVGSVPIQIVGVGGSSSLTTLPAVTQSDFGVIGGGYPDFNAFVATVTEHVAARLDRENFCLDSADSKERSLLQFMHWKIGTHDRYGPLHPVTSLDARPSNGCRISSPWIDIAIEKKPVPWIRAIVRWNTRQFLADQAVLAGVKNVLAGVAKPLTNVEFGHFWRGYQQYEDSKFFGKPTAKPIEEIVPPDILWLFRRSGYAGGRRYDEPFSIRIPIRNVISKSAENYTKLVLTLIDRCFASGDGANFHYDSIVDAADLILLEQYKITTPIND